MSADSVLTPRALNRAYLARQGLLERTAVDPVTVARRLIALQGQATHPPYTALWSRIEGITTADVDAALTDGSLARLALFRSTIHLVPGDEVYPLRQLTSDLLERDFPPALRQALDRVDRRTALARMREVVAQQPLTWSELGRAVASEFPIAEIPNHSADRVLPRLLRNLVPMVTAPPSMHWGDNTPGKYRPHPSADAPPMTRGELDEVRQDVARRFVAAYGPTSAAALTAFTGVTGWPGTFAALADEFVRIDGPTGPLVDLPDAPRPGPDVAAPARLMGEWDSALHTRTDDHRLIPQDAAAIVSSRNGIMPATVLVDGLVDGTWRFRIRPRRATLTVVPRSSWPRRVRDEVEREALRYLHFAAPGVPPEVAFG